MSDLFFEFDAQVHSPSVIAVPPQSFNETGYDYNIVGGSDDDLSIAQSNSMGEITVVGSALAGTLRFEFAGSYGDETEDEFSPDQGEGFGPPSYADFLQAQCLADLTVDQIARQIEALIKAQPDWNAREYGAFIYMVGNEVRMGELFKGTTLAEAQAAGGPNASAYVNFYMPPDIGNGVILAAVHSHPDIGFNAADDVRNRYPSDKVDSGDYFVVERLVESSAQFGNNAAFAQYIVGPDGVLREFNLSDGRLSSANDPDPDSRSDLAKDRPCFSN